MGASVLERDLVRNGELKDDMTTKTNDAAAFGARLKKRREALKLSQHALAMLSGVPAAQISDYECGRGVELPRAETIKALAPPLEWTPNDLLGVK